MYDLIIIGSGPAGLSAAIYAKRAGLELLVLEKAPMSGGQVLNTYEVDNYLGMPGMNGFDMGMQFREHADKLGIDFQEAQVRSLTVRDGVKVIGTDDGELEAKTVILATGAVHAHLGVPGEEELAGVGVSYCATCDGAFFKKRDVAVVGGGDVAVEDAVYLSRFCRKVYLIHRRDSLRAAKSLQEKLFACENVEVIWNSTLQKITGTDLVEGICIRTKGEETERELAVDGVFIAVGMRPRTEIFRETLACDEGGYLIAGEDCATNVPGIFAAGDIRTKVLRQIVTAVSDGACAVASAERYLRLWPL